MSRHAVYSDSWRAAVREGAKSSAEVLAPLITRLTGCTTVIDVGCGEGLLLNAFHQHGVYAEGVEGAWAADRDYIHTVDLAKPPYPAGLGQFDVAVCLEVAEHVPAEHAPQLVRWLTTLAPTVVFSAAVPGQGGEGHVNEQWPAYWRDLFHNMGVTSWTGALRTEVWDDDQVEWWYRQNLLVFGDLHGLPEDSCPSLVHPGAWAHKGLGKPARQARRR